MNNKPSEPILEKIKSNKGERAITLPKHFYLKN